VDLPRWKIWVDDLRLIFRDIAVAFSRPHRKIYQNAFSAVHPQGTDAHFVYRRGRPVPGSVLACHHYENIKAHLDTNTIRTVCEIGPGQGFLTKLLLEKWSIDKYYCVDLPEVYQAMSPFYAGDSRVEYVKPQDIETIEGVDLVINTASMQEMVPAEINRYFNFIKRKAKFFYCSNRVEKWITLDEESADTAQTNGRTVPIRFNEFPWGDESVLYFKVSELHKRTGAQPTIEKLVIYK
jgi:hypothetical protein